MTASTSTVELWSETWARKTTAGRRGRLIGFFVAREAALGTYCFPEQRVQVKRTRFRVPDVCVYVGREPQEQVFRTPPFLARISHHLTVEARNRPAITALRLLAVLNVLFKYASARRASRVLY